MAAMAALAKAGPTQRWVTLDPAYDDLFDALRYEALLKYPGGSLSKGKADSVIVQTLLSSRLATVYGTNAGAVNVGVAEYLKMVEDQKEQPAWKSLLKNKDKLQEAWGETPGFNRSLPMYILRQRQFYKDVLQHPASKLGNEMFQDTDTIVKLNDALFSTLDSDDSNDEGEDNDDQSTPGASRRTRGKNRLRILDFATKEKITQKFDRNKDSVEMKIAAPGKEVDLSDIQNVEVGAQAEVLLRSQHHALDDKCNGLLSIKTSTKGKGGGINLACSARKCPHDAKLSGGQGRSIKASTQHNIPDGNGGKKTNKEGKLRVVARSLIIECFEHLSEGQQVEKLKRIMRRQGKAFDDKDVDAIASAVWQKCEIEGLRSLKMCRDALENDVSEREKYVGVDGAHSSTNNAMSCVLTAMSMQKKKIYVGKNDDGEDVFEMKWRNQVIDMHNEQRLPGESAQKMEHIGLKIVIVRIKDCSMFLVAFSGTQLFFYFCVLNSTK